MAENKTLYELDPDMRKKATAAYNASHGHAPDYGFAPDRAWIEGWACAATPQAKADARDAIRELIAKHSEELEHNAYAYFELAYTRRTGWMAWITDKPLNGGPVINPDRKVLRKGQGDTPEEACSAAIAAANGV